MADRTRLLVSLLLISVALSVAGCGYPQQSRLQTAFLPAAPHPASSGLEIAEPPPSQPNPYLHAGPMFLRENPPLPIRDARADALIRRAEQKFQQGRRYYQAKELERARGEFDGAIDLMLEASEYHPPDRQGYERRLAEMVDSIHRFDLRGLGAAVTAEESAFEKAPLEDILEMTFPVDPKLKNKVTAEVQATVSQLPLTVNDTVLGYIHYFSGRGQKTMLAGLRRAGRYRPLIQRILDEEGIPQELIHLAQAESGFLPRAVSRKAAVGMWQFVAFRGREYGLQQTRLTDDRLDPERATRAAARHLRDLYHQFGDWYLAVAAYNCGPGTVQKAVERTGYADFWELRRRRVLPAETTNYVPIILAMTIMVKNAAAYGLDSVEPDPPLEYDTVEITSPTHLALVADVTDAPVPELKALNPAMLKSVAPPGYVLRTPKGTGARLLAALQLVPAEQRDTWRLHTVAAGDTLAEIGRRYRTTPGRIASANGMGPEGLPVAGDLLIVPAAVQAARPAARSTRRSVSSSRRASTSRAKKAGGTPAPAASKSTRRPTPTVTRTASNRRSTARRGH
jgi:membrane-bound lytic murein transglycosylase D